MLTCHQGYENNTDTLLPFHHAWDKIHFHSHCQGNGINKDKLESASEAEQYRSEDSLSCACLAVCVLHNEGEANSLTYQQTLQRLICVFICKAIMLVIIKHWHNHNASKINPNAQLMAIKWIKKHSWHVAARVNYSVLNNVRHSPSYQCVGTHVKQIA